MKLLLMLLVLLFAVWLWRSARQGKVPHESHKKTPLHEPQDMVDCKYCGLHLPQSEAVEGRLGLYCSTEHRQRAEG
ncbi:MAG: hypothetical protein KJ852_02830 [Gammaproteobacteria bacterium]|nr:hypothetical protein [Gammaproteobacteria bacterium]MBU0787518.1 hypothetical protein [Gammaproteobacteria bacterium]MBU0815012.1 hypothetical protein [Gammaproteobacteria bacterium]MBU1785880.1 hypothetical protein [Gammaproteobacteria bacterium]